jgi:NADH:ubiquinone oxidoreductase subunit K
MPKYLKIPTFYNFPTSTGLILLKLVVIETFLCQIFLNSYNIFQLMILLYIDGSDTIIVGLFNVILIACKESAALLVKLSNHRRTGSKEKEKF